MKKTLGVLAILLCLCSCSRKAVVDMSVEALGEEKLALYKMDVANSQLLDTVKTDKNGHFRYSVRVEKGQPEFVYVYRGDVRLASLLLEKPGKVEVKADTLGNYSVIGSESSEQFRLVEKEYADFISQMLSCEDNASAVKTYVKYYRGRVNFVLQNSKSMVVVPVLFQTLSEGVPVFSQNTDAIVFRQVCDSLKTVYPQSRFVRALESETKARERNLNMAQALSMAQQASFPELCLPDVNSQKVSLSGLNSKVILLHFWTNTDPQQSLFNTDVLKPLYEKYHKKGFEIYSVCVSTDKAAWASVVKNQGLDWINVCDGRGTASSALALYNVKSLPYSLLICDGELESLDIKGEEQLRSLLDKVL